jgi:hypothetical protein
MHEEAHTPPIPVIKGWDFLPHGNLQNHPARRGMNARTFYNEKTQILVGINEEIPVFTEETITPRLAEDWNKRIWMTIYWLEGALEEVLEDTAITEEVRGVRLYKIHARLAPLRLAAEQLHEVLKGVVLQGGSYVPR